MVAPGNPIGGSFTLPSKFIDVISTGSNTPKTAWPGYTGQRPRPAWSSRPRGGTRLRTTGSAIRSPRPPPSTVGTT
jgi:hypothetical protein